MPPPTRGNYRKEGNQRSGGGNNNNNNSNRRRNNTLKWTPSPADFEQYWMDGRLEDGQMSGQIVFGRLSINSKNRLQSFVRHDDFPADVFIDGEVDRNRALDGDYVAVSLYPVEEWATRANSKKSSYSGQEGEKEADVLEQFQKMTLQHQEQEESHPSRVALWNSEITDEDWNFTTTATTSTASSSIKSSSKHDNDTRLNQLRDAAPYGSLVRQMYDLCPPKQAKGRVVALIAPQTLRANADRAATEHFGTLHIMHKQRRRDLRPGEALPPHDEYVEFHPDDNRVPYMMVKRSECPFELISDPLELDGKLMVVVQVLDWPYGQRFPNATVLRQQGAVGEIVPETLGLLIRNDVDHGEFPPESLEDLTPFVDPNWTIPEDEIGKRTDLRQSKYIMTIDPATAKDLDDALHCIQLGPDLFEVGVHIADVTYYLQEDTALDREAARRSTTVYLVQKAIPMLPPLLSEGLCSLNPAVDRLAFSCIFYLDKEGNFSKKRPTWYGRTVIHSARRLSYEQAQQILDDETCAATEDPRTVKSLQLMHMLAMSRRKTRFEHGALTIGSGEIKFVLDKLTGMPKTCTHYPLHDTNRVVEEFMLAANFKVSEQLIRKARQFAFLRRHPRPDLQGLTNIVQRVKHSCGVDLGINSLSSKQMHDAIQEIEEGRRVRELPSVLIQTEDGGEVSSEQARKEFVEVISELLKNSMRPAQYFVAGDEKREDWKHWALAMNNYTHFTSPIRRYADVCVHRLLDKTLHLVGNQDVEADGELLAKQAEICNDKTDKAKQADSDSDMLFLAILASEASKQGKPLVSDAIVVDMGPQSFEVYVLKYRFVQRVHFQEFGAIKCSAEKFNAAAAAVDKQKEGATGVNKQEKKDDRDKDDGGGGVIRLFLHYDNGGIKTITLLTRLRVQLEQKPNSHPLAICLKPVFLPSPPNKEGASKLKSSSERTTTMDRSKSNSTRSTTVQRVPRG